MLIVWPLTRIQERIQWGELAGGRMQPGVDLSGLDRNHATIVAGRLDLWRRVIRDDRKREEIRLVLALPPRP